MSFETGGAQSYGVVSADGVVDASKRLTEYRTLRDALAAGALERLRPLERERPDYKLAEVTFLPVIPNAGKILCVGVNYLKHMQEAKREPPEIPWIFLRTNDSLVGHQSALIKPQVSDTFDWEVELGVIIGRPGKYIARADALDHIAGYTVFNDGSIREYQRHCPLWAAGKNFYRSGAMGPWMVPRADFGDAFDNVMESRLNGKVMQHDVIKEWHFDVRKIIEYCSQWARLEPGDVIAMGTPSGVGFARKPPVYMQPGDVIEVEVQGLGVLRNPVAAET
jgi:2-keto-4-pentenoate hydratase/2-oxohepta-3-ene-1,7-dioic acid hydratase in catechol pathway